jgi:hypothetical protein
MHIFFQTISALGKGPGRFLNLPALTAYAIWVSSWFIILYVVRVTGIDSLLVQFGMQGTAIYVTTIIWIFWLMYSFPYIHRSVQPNTKVAMENLITGALRALDEGFNFTYWWEVFRLKNSTSTEPDVFPITKDFLTKDSGTFVTKGNITISVEDFGIFVNNDENKKDIFNMVQDSVISSIEPAMKENNARDIPGKTVEINNKIKAGAQGEVDRIRAKYGLKVTIERFTFTPDAETKKTLDADFAASSFVGVADKMKNLSDKVLDTTLILQGKKTASQNEHVLSFQGDPKVVESLKNFPYVIPAMMYADSQEKKGKKEGK